MKQAISGLFIYWLCCSLNVYAAEPKWIESHGQSAITDSTAVAREKAIANAVSRALMSTGVNVTSRTALHQRMTVDDKVTIEARGAITAMEVLDESQVDGVYSVAVRVQVGTPQSCLSRAVRLNKTVLFTDFTRLDPQSARVGRLSNVDQALPREIARRGYEKSYLKGYFNQDVDPQISAGSVGVIGDGRGQLRRLAETHKVQYIVSGEVLDMSMLSYDDYANTDALDYRAQKLTKRLFGRFGWGRDKDVKERGFRFQLKIFDGISGEYVFDKEYQATGVWDVAASAQLGFASREFWLTDYGNKVGEVIDHAVQELGQKLNCQPFMTPIQQFASDHSVFVSAGANSGLQVGDVLQVLAQRIVAFNDASYQSTIAAPVVDLEETAVSAVVTQVHPGYSKIVLSSPINPYRRYLGVVW